MEKVDKSPPVEPENEETLQAMIERHELVIEAANKRAEEAKKEFYTALEELKMYLGLGRAGG